MHRERRDRGVLVERRERVARRTSLKGDRGRVQWDETEIAYLIYRTRRRDGHAFLTRARLELEQLERFVHEDHG